MSIVVKVLEGAANVESNLDDFFLKPPLPNTRAGVHNQEVHVATTTQLLPSILSGPRWPFTVPNEVIFILLKGAFNPCHSCHLLLLQWCTRVYSIGDTEI